MKETASINLLKGRNKGFLDKFLGWALTIGRFLVIVTETTALLMFLYRFNIDRQLIDLHDKIKQQSFIVSHFTENEATYRNLQERLALAKKVSADAEKSTTLFEEIHTLGNQYITYEVLTVEKNSIKIDATSQSIASLNSFVEALKTRPDVQVVSVDKIENKTSSATIAISLTITMKGAGSAQPTDEQIPEQQ